MSEYSYRAYSPSKHSASPTRRTPIIPPAGSAPGGGRYAGSAAVLGDGFEGWYDESISYANTPPSIPPLPPRNDIPASLQPARGSQPSLYNRDRDSDLAFGSEPTKRSSIYTTGTPDRGREAPTFRRRIRTPSTSSTESIPRSRRSSRPANDYRDRTPSRSPTRAINNPIIHTTRTPSGNIMTTIFNSQNAAVVGNAVGAAANFLGNRLRPAPETPGVDEDYDRTPGGFNSRPGSGVPDTPNQSYTLNDALGYLGSLAGPQTPQPSQPAQSPGGGGFNLGNALSYLQQQTSGQPTAPGGTGSGGIPQRFNVAGVEIDVNWILQKAGQQNPWVLLGGGVVAFWVISSIIATLIWYAVVAGILYVVYIVGVKNGGFGAIGGSPDRGRIGGGGAGTGSGYGGRPGAGGGQAGRRRY